MESIGFLTDVMPHVSAREANGLAGALAQLVDHAPTAVLALLVHLVQPGRDLLKRDPLLPLRLSPFAQKFYATHRRLLDQPVVRKDMDILVDTLIDANDQATILLALEER